MNPFSSKSTACWPAATVHIPVHQEPCWRFHPKQTDWASTIKQQEFDCEQFCLSFIACELNEACWTRLPGTVDPLLFIPVRGHGNVVTADQLSHRYSPGQCWSFPDTIAGVLMHMEPGRQCYAIITIKDDCLKPLILTRSKGVDSPHVSCLQTKWLDFLMEESIRRMRYCRQSGTSLQIELYRYLLDFLDTWQRAIPVTQSIWGHYQQTMTAIRDEIISSPDKEQHTIFYFSRKYAMSQTNLKRVFKRTFGVSLHAFVIKQCMQKAWMLNHEPDANIEDIRETVGYTERSGFIKAYKRCYGTPPRR